MRNVFDRYSQPENRLTHALACTLEADRSLICPFLKWAGIEAVPAEARLQITQQQVPGVPVSGEENDGNRRGISDACIFVPDGWAVLIEARVQAGVSIDQVCRHAETARRNGFAQGHILLLSANPLPPGAPERTTWRPWRDAYQWFRQRAGGSSPARTLTQYIALLEARMIAREYGIRGTITMFDGLRFDEENPFTHASARRAIRLLGDELQKLPDLHAIGVDPTGERRPSISWSDEWGVWDFLPLAVARGAAFTAFPHCTLALRPNLAAAAITIPHAVKGGFALG